jgi:hypothetical protein
MRGSDPWVEFAMKSLKKFVKSFDRRERREPRDFLLKRLPRHSVGAEIGVFQGNFSARILQLVQPKQLHLIDPWRYETSAVYNNAYYGGEIGQNQAHLDSIHNSVLKRFDREIQAGTVCVHRSDSASASREFPDGFFDWVYIDGNHQYEFVMDDLEKYYSKVKGGGVIAGDDYGEHGWWHDGVKKAVDEFITRGTVEVIEIAAAQFCLRKNAPVLASRSR